VPGACEPTGIRNRAKRPYNKACPQTSLGSQPTVTLRQLRLGRLTRIAAVLYGLTIGRNIHLIDRSLDGFRYDGAQCVRLLVAHSHRVSIR